MDELGSIAPLILFFVLMFGAMYFFTIRPQRKRQKEHEELLQQIRKGEKVVTSGGIYGQIESMSDDSVVLKLE
ncbi:MAG: preprotein translocase subunit YajC, partial [Chloroflexota bacterium]|nr:preprotein translocase subunit YajC [Chloroflexota bacterium]